MGVVLAAGVGKRFRSRTPKVLHPLLGRPLFTYPLLALAGAGVGGVVLVAPPGQEEALLQAARAALGRSRKELKVATAVQEEPLGTGHALLVALEALPQLAASEDPEVLVVPGDAPHLSSGSLRALVRAARRAKASAAVLTAHLDDPTSYGRVLRAPGGQLLRIVEERDASPEEREVKEVNSGVWWFRASVARAILPKLRRENAQGEYYLTDAASELVAAGERVLPVPAASSEEVLGVNSRGELARSAAIIRDRLVRSLEQAGVTVVDPSSTWVEPGVEVGEETVLMPGVLLEGETRVGRGCHIGPFTRLSGCVVGDGAEVVMSVASGAVVGRGARVGPFAYLRPGTQLAEGVRVGTFVEIKNSRVGRGSKVPHLSYVGDAEIGEGVNIGAGTITCNFDGFRKHRTVVEDAAFVGSDTMLVAPVRVGRGAYTGAGSVITRDVPPDALAVERSEQRVIPGWARRRRERARAEAEATGKE